MNIGKMVKLMMLKCISALAQALFVCLPWSRHKNSGCMATWQQGRYGPVERCSGQLGQGRTWGRNRMIQCKTSVRPSSEDWEIVIVSTPEVPSTRCSQGTYISSYVCNRVHLNHRLAGSGSCDQFHMSLYDVWFISFCNRVWCLTRAFLNCHHLAVSHVAFSSGWYYSWAHLQKLPSRGTQIFLWCTK